jgi:hypothetical protein
MAGMTSPDLSARSDAEIDTWIENHEKQGKTDAALYRALLEERARRSSHQLNIETTLAHLREAAKRKTYTTYGKVAEVNGIGWNIARRLMPKHLDRSLELCHARKWPLLTVLCVKQNEVASGDLSGDSLKGFVAGARRLGYTVTDDKKFMRECQAACFAWAEEH